MITRPIQEVKHHPTSGGVGGGWAVLFTHETLGLYHYLIPVSMLWYRSAEYEIDLADGDTLLDVVLHELAGMSLGHEVDPTDPSFVYKASAQTAWAAHQARLGKVKQQVSHHDPQKLLGQIVDHHKSNLKHPELTEIHTQHQQVMRRIRLGDMMRS